ncbi:hypothetical protein PBRA_002846 [Plasmodiophora brassicae]|uniref:RRM domain-containing protein n=1 Tax=Plasmodiophora brassicae TaxID=37360 RepID=A0A0G4J5J8_PLABS|nr:hypothetical protein PBRA_002846 [Plasmodiophora brassicae]
MVSSNASPRKPPFNADADVFQPSTRNTGTRAPRSAATLPESKASMIPSSCIWVGNVCPKVTEAEFRSEFSRFGPIRLLRMFPKSKCAFITYETSDQALAAQAAMENTMMGSMALTLNVGRCSRHLWVGNVGPGVDEASLTEAFQKFGEVESVRILRNNKCAFVNMVSEQAALIAAQQLNGHRIADSEITINFQWQDSKRHGPHNRQRHRATQDCHQNVSTGYSRSHASGRQSGRNPVSCGSHYNYAKPSRQLFVGNIDPEASQATMFALFQQFGEVQRIKRFYDRCYAFVVYSNISDSIWARDHLTMFPPVLFDRTLNVNFGRSSVLPSMRTLSMTLMLCTEPLQPKSVDLYALDPRGPAKKCPVVFLLPDRRA